MSQKMKIYLIDSFVWKVFCTYSFNISVAVPITSHQTVHCLTMSQIWKFSSQVLTMLS